MNYFKEKYAAVHTLKAARALAVFHLKMDPHCETMKDEAIQQCNNEMCVFKYFLYQASKPKFPCLLHLKTYRALIHNTLVISRTPYTWECPEALLVAFGRNGNWLLLDREHTKKKKKCRHTYRPEQVWCIFHIYCTTGIFAFSRGSCGREGSSHCVSVYLIYFLKMTYLLNRSGHTDTRTHTCSKKCTQSPHKVRGTVEMFPFLKIESVMEAVAGDELCLCQRRRECDQVSSG